METQGGLGALLFLLIAAVIAVPLFRRLNLGAILGYLTAGVLIGPAVFDLVSDPANILHLSEIGVVLLLFVIGLELNPEKLWSMRKQIAGLGVGQLVFSAAIVATIVLLVTDSSKSAIVIGLALALSSTAFAIQLMAEKGILASPAGRQGFAILLLQDLAVIPILLLVSSLSNQVTEDAPAWWQGVAGVIFLLLVGRFALNPLLKIISNYGSRESMTAAGLLIVVGAAFLMQSSGLSMGMGAFVAGIMLANSSFRHQLESDIEPFKGLTLGLFFIAIGMSLDLQLFLRQPWMLLLMALGLMAAKSFVIASLLKLSGVNWRLGMQMGLMLSQGGEFAFVIMNQAIEGGSVVPEIAAQVNLVVGLSMALTSPLISLLELFRAKEEKCESKALVAEFHESPEVMIMGFGRFGQTTGRILSANGIPFIALDKDAEHIDFVKQFGNRVHYGDASRLDVLQAAGIEQVKSVLISIDDSKQAESITLLIRQMFPDITIIARAHNRASYWALRSAGAQHVIREVFHSSLEAAASTLNSIGFSTGEALKTIEEFNSHDKIMLKQSFEHREDIDKLIDIGRRGRSDLERLFKQDQEH